jgi:hypothetical protein
MDVKIKWNGGNFEDALNRAAFSQVRDNVGKALRGARCGVHGKVPERVEVTGHDLKSLGWKVYGCCEDGLTAAAARALR